MDSFILLYNNVVHGVRGSKIATKIAVKAVASSLHLKRRQKKNLSTAGRNYIENEIPRHYAKRKFIFEIRCT